MIRYNQPYVHYKGCQYLVTALALNTETKDRMVVYCSISQDDDETYVRPLSVWNEEVVWPDGIKRPRFILR